MATVIANMSMSLDGFIADPHDGVEDLFGWYGNGEVAVPSADDNWTFHTSEASARQLREGMAAIGSLVCGRRLFDHTGGWGGTHPAGVPVFVVTHSVPDGRSREEPPFTFVTGGVVSAVEQAARVAGERVVAVASASIAQQCLDAGLLDAVQVDLVPVLMGGGIRFFEHLRNTPVRLGDPTVVEGTGVTHLRYAVLR